MTLARNRYSQLAAIPANVVYSLEAALEEVHLRWPSAYMEGSAGLERVFLIPDDEEPLIVAHVWNSGRPTKDQKDRWYLKVTDEPFSP